MAVNPGDIIQVVAQMGWGDDVVNNVFHLKHNGSSAVPELNVITQARAWLDNAYSNLTSRQSEHFTYDLIWARNLTQGTPIGVDVWPTLAAGDDVTNDLATLQAGPLVRFATNLLGSQGRKFLTGFTEQYYGDGGAVGAAFQTDLGLWGLDILNGFDVVLNDFIPGNWNATLARFTPWVSAIVNTYLAVQRSRTPGRGS